MKLKTVISLSIFCAYICQMKFYLVYCASKNVKLTRRQHCASRQKSFLIPYLREPRKPAWLKSVMFTVHADENAGSRRRRGTGSLWVLAVTGRAADLQRGLGTTPATTRPNTSPRHEVLWDRHHPSQGTASFLVVLRTKIFYFKVQMLWKPKWQSINLNLWRLNCIFVLQHVAL